MQKPERAEAPRPASRAAGTLLAALLLAGLLAGPPALAQEPAEPEVDTTASRTLALQLYREHHYLDALPLLEQLAAEDSDDAQVQEALGFCLLATAATLDDPEERRQMRLRARQALLRSQELGNDTSFVRTLLEQLPPDGSETPFSANPAVDAAMREGEAAFVAGDWEAALTAYHRALALDPTHYEAALFIGDVYFAQRQLEEAVRWFAVAVRNDPNGETAYRYWGDALMLQDRQTEAREKFIEAVVAEPYRESSWHGLGQWARRNRVQVGHPRIESPNQRRFEDDSIEIIIDPESLMSTNGTANWMFYELTRNLWQTQKFAELYPNEPEYRHSLQEEAEALRAVIRGVGQDREGGQIESLDSALEVLLALERQGLLEAYILLARADEGIVQDYVSYRAEHRDNIRQYLDDYVVPRLE